MDRLQLRYLAEYGLFQTFLFALRCLPVRTAFRIADGLAWLMHHVAPRRLSRYEVSQQNLQLAFGETVSDSEIDQMIHGMWKHLFRMVCEIIQLPRRMRLYNGAEILKFTRREDCVAALCSGRPVIFLGGHFGNWEISVNTFGHFGFPMGVVARELDNPWLQRWFREFRESTGNSLILKQGAGSELSEIMERNGMVSLLCDQDAGRSGVFVDFFGKPASTFKSIALLALQYNALVVVGGAYRLPSDQQLSGFGDRNAEARWSQFDLVTQDIIDSAEYQGADGLKQLTQRFTTSLEQLIRRAPEQYFWVHRRWKTPPGARRNRNPAA